ncbi:response regulators consisting of a CheY-like receiver domain and a winged-helix DNA-binding domain [Longilinea arvoryzae]|uniref:Response regulators consisting of a CheY-like receiver domain and a winged-helix DNA-binding domain n=1 Tax=Longilinea arvoryzae TaxID=360412 RepID=A0A0K8MXI4_9CHLR|nr:response regulator [Longilinea arvoryzae]GAP15973.1 response regulators consisting of a CheY-like receiver domain and a winged-helix DNA-binding domain [Longilinea arvoryzae]
MARVLLIDDEPVFYKMVEHALKPQGYELEYARSGLDGLRAAGEFEPEIIIVDVKLPDLDGYDVVQRLRSTPRFRNTPIIFLTSQADLPNKLKGFEVGADDFLAKPFQPEELLARIGILVRKSETLRSALPAGPTREPATVLALHSLRGGVGCTSLAVNLAIACHQLWEKPTLLIDADMTAGQVALMLNTSPARTFDDLTNRHSSEIDDDIIRKITSKHNSGINFIASPSSPVADDSFADDLWVELLNRLQETYDFIIIDTGHNFGNIAIHMLNQATTILQVIAPEMASIRSSINALELYHLLGYPSEKIKPVLNQTLAVAGIKQAQIEKVLKLPVSFSLPYAPNEFIRAINFGQPVILQNPEIASTELLEEMAYDLSGESLKAIPPSSPSVVWKRVTQKLAAKK